MLVAVYGYEQNPSRSVGGVMHTKSLAYMVYSKKNHDKTKVP